jgi:hypothetical protein
VVVDGYRLRHGGTLSCGCYRKEVMREQIRNNAKTRAHIGNAASLLIRDHVNIGAMTAKSRKNRSGVIGVSRDAHSKLWNARLVINGKLVLNKRFAEFDDAVAARRAAEAQYLQPLLEAYAPERLATSDPCQVKKEH